MVHKEIKQEMKTLKFEISHTRKTVNRLSRMIVLFHAPGEFVITETTKEWFLKCVDIIPWRMWKTNYNGIWMAKKTEEYKETEILRDMVCRN